MRLYANDHEINMSCRIAFVVNNAAFFVSHRLPIAMAVRRAGFDVMLVTGQAGSEILEAPAAAQLDEANIQHRRVAFRSDGTNPIVEGLGFLQLVMALWRYRPDVVHCVSPKGVLYGGIAARLIGCPSLVLAVSGMGYVFTGAARGWKSFLRRAYSMVAGLAYEHTNKRVIVQNRDDLAALTDSGLAKAHELVLIPGSGVALGEYAALDPAKRTPLVVLPARMLKDKGVVEFAQAAELIRKTGCNWRFALVGTADYQNPSSVPMEDIRRWVDAGMLEWWGHRQDMVDVFAQASIVCLPSYREGMPKALLEAAAAGCAVVTTDVVGCREAVIDGETGDLVQARDSVALADALLALINDPQRQARYASAGKRWATNRFSVESVIEKTLLTYRELMNRAKK